MEERKRQGGEIKGESERKMGGKRVGGTKRLHIHGRKPFLRRLLHPASASLSTITIPAHRQTGRNAANANRVDAQLRIKATFEILTAHPQPCASNNEGIIPPAPRNLKHTGSHDAATLHNSGNGHSRNRAPRNSGRHVLRRHEVARLGKKPKPKLQPLIPSPAPGAPLAIIPPNTAKSNRRWPPRNFADASGE